MPNQFILSPFFLDEPRDALKLIAHADWTLNAPALPEGDKQTRMACIYENLAQAVEQTVRRGARPVSLAGDCCAAIGVLAGLQRAGIAPTVLWLDAHGDFNTWETTPSGFLGGMPLAMLVGRGEQTLPRAVELQALDEARVVLCDARDLDAGEKIALENSRIRQIGDVRQIPLDALMHVPLYVHFDADLINPRDAPAQSYATPGGPSARELKMFFHALADSETIVAVSLSAWNPAMDADGKTRAVSMELLRVLVGEAK
jgi:arginase